MKMEVTTRVTHSYLMNKTKHDLAIMILGLLDELEEYRQKEIHINARYWDMSTDGDELVVLDENGEPMDLTGWSLITGRLIKPHD